MSPARSGLIAAMALAGLSALGGAPGPGPELPPRRELLVLSLPGQPARRVLVTIPARWQAGDPGAIVVAGAEDAPRRDRLAAILLAHGAAVLELDIPRQAAGRAVQGPGPKRLLPELFAGLRELHLTLGAGAVAVYGWEGDASGSAALLAQDAMGAERNLGPHGPRFVAHAVLGEGCRAVVPRHILPGVHRRDAVWRGSRRQGAAPTAHPSPVAEACALAVLPRPGEAWPLRDDAPDAGRRFAGR